MSPQWTWTWRAVGVRGKDCERRRARRSSSKPDVSEGAQVEQMVARTEEVFGRLDIVHNNAIWYDNAPATELRKPFGDRTLDTGLKAIYLAARYAFPTM